MSLWLVILIGELPFLAILAYLLPMAIKDEREGYGLFLPRYYDADFPSRFQRTAPPSPPTYTTEGPS